MERPACFLATVLLLGHQGAVFAQDQRPALRKQLPDGVYAVERDSVKKKDVLPLKKGEALVMHHHRYLQKSEKEPPRSVVVRLPRPVALDLKNAPRAVKEKGKVVRILLQLQPKAAAALERLTRDQHGRQVAIVLGGEIVTMHKVREVVKGGQVQITSCTPGAAPFLLKRLQAHHTRTNPE